MKSSWLLALVLVWQACNGAEPDIETACLDCHRARRGGEVPAIEGQQREYLQHQLRRFRERHRDSFPMSAFARGMDDATIEVIASALAERPWASAPSPVSEAVVRRGREVAGRRDCGSCHGEHFLGAGDIPRLAGQQAGYLARQIEGFGRGDRYHPPSGTGSPMRSVPADQAQDLAGFLHRIGDEGSAASDVESPSHHR